MNYFKPIFSIQNIATRLKQRLSSYKADFEVRVKFLADILLVRGYDFRLLRRQFCRALDKYVSEFQKWALPLNLVTWFNQIVR